MGISKLKCWGWGGVGRLGRGVARSAARRAGRRAAPPERDISSYTPHSYQPTMVAGGRKTRVDQTGARLSRKRKRGRRAQRGAAMNTESVCQKNRMRARGFFCSQNSARPGFSEPKIATLASYVARIVELSLFMNKNGQYSGFLYFFINKRVPQGPYAARMPHKGHSGA